MHTSQRLSGLSPCSVHHHRTSYSRFSIADSRNLKVPSSRFSDLDPLNACEGCGPFAGTLFPFLFSISSRPSDGKRESCCLNGIFRT
ncbi:hypothetical protein TNIN_199551 [Trichonephila inaurata madagascariensis]|uniref:Uncharacterized protein n=1 Tax=Trichonephila inaurata madagascariensis TaxID=2747483 RepID=A0A8X6XH64_9ARAC|nr:hypothetical protein TNIN_199551 [Trichonephila inaurata madagascariensis]